MRSETSPERRQEADLIIEAARFLVTDSRTVLEDASIAVTGGRIAAVGPAAEIAARYSSRNVVAAHEKIAMPGLVNVHIHSTCNFMRGVGDDLPVFEWAEHALNRAFRTSTFASGDVHYLLNLATHLELVKGGTTTFASNWFFPEQQAKATRDSGLRGLICPIIYDSPLLPWCVDADDGEGQLRNAVECVERWHGAEDERIRVWLGPYATYFTSPRLFMKCRDASRSLGVGLHTHLAESEEELKLTRQMFGKRPVEHAQEIRALGSDVMAAHCVWLDDDEIRVLAETRTKVLHNPVSNAKLAYGVCRVTDLLEAGVDVGLGTDGQASNNSQDMFEVMKFTSCLQKVRTSDASALPARDAFDLATIGGARCCGLEEDIGTLEPGKCADVLLVDSEAAHFVPLIADTVISHLVYDTNGSDVETAIVGGRVIMRDRRLVELNERAVVARARDLADEFARSALHDADGLRDHEEVEG